ncbi:MAG: hypothetical protein IH988_03465, partial [Planctomycetes bacterium]|nr:hypothetical protein [Planctomycetota bacterium]
HRGLWSAGRGNHYLFDLNRDWLVLAQPETRGRAAEMLKWNPHLVVDSHEMGGLDTYLFDPPREPFNVDLSKNILDWRRRFSADQARAFDQFGWSYYTREWYEEWYPGYTNAWGSLLGAVGLLYEQAGVNSASLKQPSGMTLTYRQAVHHHVVSSMANLETLRANRREILADFLADRRSAVDPTPESRHTGTFLLPPSPDTARRQRLIELLDRQGIEMSQAAGSIDAHGAVDVWGHRDEQKTLPPETIVISSAQPHARLLHAILGFDPHTSDKFLNEERKELERRRESKLYDVTAWNLSMAYGLEAYWAETVEPAELRPVDVLGSSSSPALATGRYGYLIDGASSQIYEALVALFNAECKPRVATKPFKHSGTDYLPGTVLLRNHENPATLHDVLTALGRLPHVHITPVDGALSEQGPDLGGQRFDLLHPPRVAIASQWPIATTSFGAVWHLLDDRLGMRCSPINVQALERGDLRKYNVLILPHSRGLSRALGDGEISRLKTWVQSGGTLIALSSAATLFADEKRDFSAVRRKRDVLDKLDVYAEALKRENDARTIDVDPADVWGAGATAESSDVTATTEVDASSDTEEASDHEKAPETENESKAAKEKDTDTLRRQDEWQRIYQPHGVMVGATLDPEHWLCFGLGDRLPVLLSGDSAYMSKHPVATPVRLMDEDELRLSGLLWPEARSRWANTAYATIERVGNGQLILFASDPFVRGYLEGSGRLLLNAIILGPGMGTQQPLPW